MPSSGSVMRETAAAASGGADAIDDDRDGPDAGGAFALLIERSDRTTKTMSAHAPAHTIAAKKNLRFMESHYAIGD